MIEVKNGKLTVAKSRELTKKQVFLLSKLTGSERDGYLWSLLGLTKRHVYVDRFKSGRIDVLGRKSPGTTLMRQNEAINPNYSHVPLNIGLGNWIGVEIECFLPGESSDECSHCDGSGTFPTFDEDGEEDGGHEDCNNCGGTGRVTRRGGRSTDNPKTRLKSAIASAKLARVSVKEDGSLSCDNGGVPVEVTMVYNSALGHGKLEQLLKVLNDAGAYVNTTCGLHVHLDMRHFKQDGQAVRVLGRRLTRCLPVLKYMMPASRRNNHYCRLEMNAINSDDRYCAINLTAFRKFQTIEVRLHSGSVSFEKISNWIDLLKAIVKSEKITAPIQSFQDLIDKAGLNEKLVAYVEKRLAKHGPEMVTGTPNQPNTGVA